jgi:hypothetical protein
LRCPDRADILGAVSASSASPQRPLDRLGVAWVLLALSAACTPWPGDTVHHYRPPREPPAPLGAERAGGRLGLDPDALTSDLEALGPGLPDLSGTWGQLQVTATLSNAPMLGELRSSTTTLFLLELDQRGEQLRGTATVCDLAVASEGGMRTIIPDRFVAALEPAEVQGRVEEFAGGYRFVQAPYTQVLGARLDEPDREPLPRDPSDPRVTDQDGDGRPGMTIRVEGLVGGDIYTVQRTTRALEGVVRDLERIDGHIDWTMEQVTLDASSFLLDIDTRARADPDPRRNLFFTRRVAPGTSCDGLLDRREALFLP